MPCHLLRAAQHQHQWAIKYTCWGRCCSSAQESINFVIKWTSGCSIATNCVRILHLHQKAYSSDCFQLVFTCDNSHYILFCISELGSLSSLSCTAARFCHSLLHCDRRQFVHKLPVFWPLCPVGLEHWPVPRGWRAFLSLQCSNLHQPSFRMQISSLCLTRPTRWVNLQLPRHALTLRNLVDN